MRKTMRRRRIFWKTDQKMERKEKDEKKKKKREEIFDFCVHHLRLLCTSGRPEERMWKRKNGMECVHSKG